MELANGEIHVWQVDLGSPTWASHDLSGCLSEDEIQQARRRLMPGLQVSYLRAHASVRQLLAGYAGEAPSRLEFGAGPSGKPFLKGRGSELFFNYSHSGGMLLLAVSRSTEIGVDIEAVSRKTDTRLVAARFFSQADAAWLDAQPEAERSELFYRLWVCEEAVLKGAGAGLEGGLQRVILPGLDSLRPGGKLRVDIGFGGIFWKTWVFQPQSGFEAALAVPAQGPGDWSGEIQSWLGS